MQIVTVQQRREARYQKSPGQRNAEFIESLLKKVLYNTKYIGYSLPGYESEDDPAGIDGSQEPALPSH